MPLISPYDWKYTIYLLTKYYPELIQDTYPWNEEPDFGKLILLTYHKVKYRTLFRRLISGYYCFSSCCKHEEENIKDIKACLLYTSPSPRDGLLSRMPSSA